MSEGFMVMSRWGHKLHKVGCPCGVCASKRKKHHVSKQKASELDEDVSCTTMVTSRQANTAEEETAPTAAASNPPGLAQSSHSEGQAEASAVNGVSALTTAPATDANSQAADSRLSRADKSLPKTRFSMELAALGTPGVPLNKTRVPRQAATAAKAAIKKDLLMQNSRPGASSVPPKGTSLPATKPATVTATKPTASKLQKASHPASKAKRRSNRISRDDEVSAQPPAGPIDDDDMLPAASALHAGDAASDDLVSETAAAATAVVTAAAAEDAAPLVSSATVASPQRSAKTSPHSHQSPSMSHYDDTVQDAVQSAELPDGGDDAGGAEGQDPALPGSLPQLPMVPPPAAPAPQLSPVEQFAQEVRSKAKWGPAVDVNVRGLMASGIMAGQPVHIQLKHKDPVYLQGVIQATGLVRCAQHEGGPANHECSLSEYEKLGYSKERRPGENVHLTNFSLALKDFCALVNDIGEKARNRCLHCKQGSGLVRCKGCSVAAHPTCVGLVSRQQQANWFCEECKTSGQDKLPQRPQDLQGRSRAPPQRPPSRPHSAAAAPSHPAPTQSKPNTGRVHMAVPVSGMTPARRERNGNKHKRLFMGGPGGLTDGEPVEYRTAQQGVLQKGVIFIKPGLDAQAGILCECCNQVVSCSKFEAHAGQGSRRAPYDNIFTAEGITLRARAAMLPPLLEGDVSVMSVRGPRRVSHSRSKGNAVHHTGQLGGIADGCRDVIHDLDHDAGGCNICGRPDFALGAFCDRTMILCDQCECEFHVGCLRKAARCDLSQLPTGDWFCSEDCSGIWQALNGRVAAGPALLDTPDYSLQLMRGRDTSGSIEAEATNDAIDTAQQVLQESFDPIIDKATKENLLLLMTKAEVKGEYDYRGMYTALLTHQGRAVCAAVFRAFGAQLAEVPLVATKADARRQGHCRVLMSAFEVLLKEAGVRTMCLPAAYSTVHTWIQGFGLQPMPDDDLDAACKDLRLLIFPGTQVLHKQLLPPLPPKQGPLMTPPWAEEPAAPPPTDAQTAVDPSSEEPQQTVHAEGVTVTPPLPVLEAKAEASAAATAVEAPSDTLLPDQTQPEPAPMPSADVVRPVAADDTPMTDAQSDSAAAVEALADAALGEPPTTASAQDQAVFQDSPGTSPAAASVEPAQVLSLPSEDHDMPADVRPESALAQTVSQDNGDLSEIGPDVEAPSPPMHLEHEPGTFIKEDDGNSKTEEASAVMQGSFVQAAALGENQQPPAASSWQQDVSASQPSHQQADQHTTLLLASAAADHAPSPDASPDASSDAYPSLVSGLPHATQEDPFMHEALAQHAASAIMSQPWSPHHTESAAADTEATVAAQVCQAPDYQSHGLTASPGAQRPAVDFQLPSHHQSPGATAQPMASSHDTDAMLPEGMVAPQAPAIPSSAYSNGLTLNSHQPQALEQNGLPSLADELMDWEQQVRAQPVEQSAFEKAGEQQAMAKSNGWHVQEPGSHDYKQPQDTVGYTGLAVSQCTETQELVQSSTVQGSHELPAPEGQSQDVPVAQYPGQINAMPGQLVSQSAEPLFVGKKRHLGDGDGDQGDPDNIVAKKPCLVVSGSV